MNKKGNKKQEIKAISSRKSHIPPFCKDGTAINFHFVHHSKLIQQKEELVKSKQEKKWQKNIPLI
jgi:nitroimidazol reductase NimA-like FMN-containing flavoprotein (pyridoxamine 5'-phosphate oxidase superfamily)